MSKKEIKSRVLMSLLFFAVLMFLSAWFNIQDYIYDAEYYWETGDVAVKDGVFRLDDYPKTFRGCYLPIIIAILKCVIGHGCLAWRVFINLLVSVEFSILLPNLFSDSISENNKQLRLCLALFVYLLFFGNFLQYPLSDFVAFFFFTVSVVMMRIIVSEEKTLRVVIHGIICGIFLYLAYNTRVVFLWGGIALVLNAVLCFLKAKNVKKLILTSLAVGIAIIITALPQMIVNSNNEGVYSPRVYTENYAIDSKLENLQILWGMTYPRYETTLREEEWGKAQMVWVDPAGTELVNKSNIAEESFGKKAYFGICLRNPVDMLAIYTRHFVSATTPFFTQVLVTNLHIDRTAILFTIISLWFVAGVAVFENIKCGKMHLVGWMIPIVLPSVMQMMGAVEIRFFLPIYAVLIYYVCTVVDFKELNNKTKNKRLELIVVYIVIFLLWTAIYSDLLAMNVDSVFLINE